MNRVKWALLVGACTYDFHPSLKYSATDATRLARALETRLGFDRRRMLVLADSDDFVDFVDFEPTRRDIFHTFGLLADEHSDFYRERELDPIGEDDLFVFYFSGHGVRRDRDEYLLPVESTKYSITETAVRLEAVVGCIENLPCRHKVLFLDACRDELYRDEGAKSVSGAKGIGRPTVVDREGLATFYSCDPGQRSYEIEELRHGAFTYCLLEAINHPDVNTLEELDKFLKSRVPKENHKACKEPQQPFLVPNPADMLQLDLFRLPVVETGTEQLVAMTNQLYNDGVIDFDWWEKLQSAWDAEDEPNFRLKQGVLKRLYEGKLTFERFADHWRRADRHMVPPSQPNLDLRVPGPGEREEDKEAAAVS